MFRYKEIMSKIINGYNYHGYGITYKVYLPCNFKYKKKERPVDNIMITKSFIDSYNNKFYYCFNTHYEEDEEEVNKKNIFFDYDNKNIEDPDCFYNVLIKALSDHTALEDKRIQILLEHAGMYTLDHRFTYKIPNCYVEIMDEEVTPGKTREELLESLQEQELRDIVGNILNRKLKETGKLYGLKMPVDEKDARQRLISFIKENEVTGGSLTIPKDNIVFIYDSKQPSNANFNGTIILKSESDIYYIINLSRWVNKKVLAGLKTLSKRTLRDFPNISTNIKTAKDVYNWLQQNNFISLVVDDTIPSNMHTVKI